MDDIMTTPNANLENKSIIGQHNHLYYSNGRLFINSVLGCLSKCSYCYLEQLNFPLGRIHRKVRAQQIIEQIELHIANSWSPRNSIASLGCYSDPWDRNSREDSIEIIKYLDQRKFKTTISTKQFVSSSSLSFLSTVNKRNLIFLISLPVANNVRSHEKGTCSIQMRIQSIFNLRNLGFNVALYVKPFIPRYTTESIPKIVDIVKDYKIPIVFGRMFTSKGEGGSAVVSDAVKLFETEPAEYLNVNKILKTIAPVYEHSYEVFDFFLPECGTTP